MVEKITPRDILVETEVYVEPVTITATTQITDGVAHGVVLVHQVPTFHTQGVVTDVTAERAVPDSVGDGVAATLAQRQDIFHFLPTTPTR